MANFYTSDLHIFHKNVTKQGTNFDSRNFNNLDEMHEIILNNWNSTVTNGDRVFITKGDNNDDIDLYPVKESQFAGVIKFDIPYLGYPTLMLSRLLNTGVEDTVIVDKGRTN